MSDSADYDPRYLAGIVLFNRGDFFEAHEAWEALWMDTAGPDKPFYQGLIQAAVGLFHYSGGNTRGAAKLYRSGRAYMEPYGSPYLGLDSAAFWAQMERCFAPLLQTTAPVAPALEELSLPRITLSPPPAAWPDPADHRPED